MTEAERARWRATLAAVAGAGSPPAPADPLPHPGQLQLWRRLCGQISIAGAILAGLDPTRWDRLCRCGRELHRRRVPRVGRTLQDPLGAPAPAPRVPGPVTSVDPRKRPGSLARSWYRPSAIAIGMHLELLESAAERAEVAVDVRRELERYVATCRDDGRSWRPV